MSKALQRDQGIPVPLLTDFVKVAAHYAAADVVSLLTLTGLVRLGRFGWKSSEALELARAFDPQNRDERLVRAFVDALRRLPAESIEDLLAREDVGAEFYESAVFDAPIRFRYAISRIFSLIGWNVRLDLLHTFLSDILKNEAQHTVVSFNYDLFLDRAISESVKDWHWHCGYGFEVPYAVTADPTDHGVDAQSAGAHVCQSLVRLLKPHGSLNWLLPVHQPSAAMPFCDGPTTVRVDSVGRPEYVNTLELWPRVLYPNGNWPGKQVGLGIVAPLRRKETALKILKDTRTEEFTAVLEADEAFVLGWSIPETDDDQRSLIRYAASMRAKPLDRVVVVNLNQPPDYFERIAETFIVNSSSVQTWNDGFSDYMRAYIGEEKIP